LQQDSTLSNNDIIEIYRMRSIAFYVLGKEELSKISFYEILNIEPKFMLDPIQNSPKIVAFFNAVKLTYLQSQLENESLNQSNLQSTEQKTVTPKQNPIGFKSALWRSILYPGWGHFYLQQKRKGTYLSIGSLILLPTTIYFSYDAYNKEKDYLNEIDVSKIKSSYKTYNNSYKTRNVLLASYAVLWIYTQLDLSSAGYIQNIRYFGPSFSYQENHNQTILISIGLDF